LIPLKLHIYVHGHSLSELLLTLKLLFYIIALECSRVIVHAIDTDDFRSIVKVAHQVKGSASYFMIKNLISCAQDLQDLSSEGTVYDFNDKLMKQINTASITKNKAVDKQKVLWRGKIPQDSIIIWEQIRQSYNRLHIVLDKLKVDLDRLPSTTSNPTTNATTTPVLSPSTNTSGLSNAQHNKKS
jgi:HPt (histidine-containing phosphotransfer) domain-containing protein